jgi:hypothetical protein
MRNEQLYKKLQAYHDRKQDKKISNGVNPYSLINFISLIDGWLTEFREIDINEHRNPAGLFSASSVIKYLKEYNSELLYALIILYKFDKSKMLGTLTNHPKYASLTPIFLYAQKLNGNMYEEWDKTDPELGKLCGKSFTSMLGLDIPKVPWDVQALRDQVSLDDPTKYKGGPLVLDSFKVPSTNIMNKMLLQSWLANVKYRMPNIMVLDPWDWDAVPEIVDVVETTTSISDIPWD